MTTPDEYPKYLPQLKDLLSIAEHDHAKDNRLLFVLQSIVEAVKTYCNIDSIPASHDHVVLMIAEDYYRDKYPTEFERTAAPVVSVKRGDVQTTFGNAKATVVSGPGAAFVQGYAAQLHAIRRMRW